MFVLLGMFVLLASCGGKQMTTIATTTTTFETNQGTIVIELFTKEMPITTGNFIKLAKGGFYDGTRFHRIIAGFMIQGGDPQSKEEKLRQRWGTGGPGYTIKDEFAKGLSNVPGTIAMANAGPNTGGSQFFINVAANTFLDGKHPVFGKVTEGMEIVQKISQVETNSGDQPVEDIVIKKVTITG